MREAMYRQSLLIENEALKSLPLIAPNVSSVPQYSPLRYPGGKTWIYPFIIKWFEKNKAAKTLIEPFTGGASVSLIAGIEKRIEKILMVELDEDIAAFWNTVLSEDGVWLANSVLQFQFNDANIKAAISNKNHSVKNRAFAVLLNNRINRGGILAPGAGKVKNGENGKGLRSRWYPITLYKRILKIYRNRERFKIICSDGIKLINKYKDNPSKIFFIDPPYTIAGKRLYNHYEIDHEALFETLTQVKGDLLITYDNSEYIINLATQFGFEIEEIVMQTTHLTKKTELIIGKNLDWLR